MATGHLPPCRTSTSFPNAVVCRGPNDQHNQKTQNERADRQREANAWAIGVSGRHGKHGFRGWEAVPLGLSHECSVHGNVSLMLLRVAKYAWLFGLPVACIITKPSPPQSRAPLLAGQAPTASLAPSASGVSAAPTPSVALRAEPLPPAAVAPLPYVAKMIPLPMPISRVTSIHGTGPSDVWLLFEAPASAHGEGFDYLVMHSDGNTLRLMYRNPCQRAEDGFFGPHYSRVHATPGQVTMLGESCGGLCASAIAQSVRNRLICDGSDSHSLSSLGSAYCESDSRIWLVQELGDMLDIRSLSDGTHPDGVNSEEFTTPLLIMHADARHGWTVTNDPNRKYLVEWTGIRWRLRDDALPAGVEAKDLLDMAVAQGTEWAVTKNQLLRFNGVRFEALSVPLGFDAQELRAVNSHEVWTFAPGVVYRYCDASWQMMRVALAPTAQWAAPGGDVWLAGDVLAPTRAKPVSNKQAPARSPAVKVLRLVPAANKGPRP